MLLDSKVLARAEIKSFSPTEDLARLNHIQGTNLLYEKKLTALSIVRLAQTGWYLVDAVVVGICLKRFGRDRLLALLTLLERGVRSSK